MGYKPKIKDIALGSGASGSVDILIYYDMMIYIYKHKIFTDGSNKYKVK